jgi:hypothetical protein
MCTSAAVLTAPHPNQGYLALACGWPGIPCPDSQKCVPNGSNQPSHAPELPACLQVLKGLDHPGIPRYLTYFEEDDDQDRRFYLVQVSCGEGVGMVFLRWGL